MRKTKKLKPNRFRYLTKKEIKNPLYAVADFCRNVTSLTHWRQDIDQIIRVSATDDLGLKRRDFANMHFCWLQLCKHIELIYILKHTVQQWHIEPESPFYELKRYPRTAIIFDATLYKGTYLEFDRLSNREFDDIGFFISKFFRFKSLKSWRVLMDKLLSSVFTEGRLGDYGKYYHQESKIYRYLEKLTEVIFLIYITKAKAFILEHHAADFLLDEELKEASDGRTISEEQNTVKPPSNSQASDEPPENPSLADDERRVTEDHE